MLGTPINGWAEIKIGQEKIGNASYLTDPAMDCLDAFLRYFDTNSFLPFGLIFDAEGYYFGIMEFADYLYIADDKTDDDKFEVLFVYEYASLFSKNIFKMFFNILPPSKGYIGIKLTINIIKLE